LRIQFIDPKKGDEGNALYCVFSGAVGIYNITKDEEGDEKQTMVAQIIPYEVIGEISILYGQKRTATAIATEDSELLVLDQEILTTILKVFFESTEIGNIKKIQTGR